MIAALPMYDRPETAAAQDRLWALVRDALRAGGHQGPEALTRPEDPWPVWLSPDLVLAQTCGLPYRARLHGKVQLLGSPDYGLPGCAAGYYTSVVISRADDPRPVAELCAARVVINEGMSQSGWAALADFAAARQIALTRPALSGGHRVSARMVADGAADIAAIDAQTWRLLSRHDPWTAGLSVRGHTRPTPALPYICAAGVEAGPIRAALCTAIARLRPEDRAALNLRALVTIPAESYLAEPIPPAPESLPPRVCPGS